MTNDKVELLNVAVKDLEDYVKKLLDAKEYWYPTKSIEQVMEKVKFVKDTLNEC